MGFYESKPVAEDVQAADEKNAGNEPDFVRAFVEVEGVDEGGRNERAGENGADECKELQPVLVYEAACFLGFFVVIAGI